MIWSARRVTSLEKGVSLSIAAACWCVGRLSRGVLQLPSNFGRTAKPQRLMISWRNRNASSRQLRMADNAQVLIDSQEIGHCSLNTEFLARTLQALPDHFAAEFRLADDLSNFLSEVPRVERSSEKARGTVL